MNYHSINELVDCYKKEIYSLYKPLKESNIILDNKNLWFIFEYYSCILLSEEYNKLYYHFNYITADYKETNNLPSKDHGFDASNLTDTIVQCKLRTKALNYGDLSTFFASNVHYCEVTNTTILKYKNMILTRNDTSTLSPNLECKKKTFIDKLYNINDISKIKE